MMTIFSSALEIHGARTPGLITAIAAIGLAGLRRAARHTAGGETSSSESARTGSPDLNPQADLEGLRKLDPDTITRVHNLYFPAV